MKKNEKTNLLYLRNKLCLTSQSSYYLQDSFSYNFIVHSFLVQLFQIQDFTTMGTEFKWYLNTGPEFECSDNRERDDIQNPDNK